MSAFMVGREHIAYLVHAAFDLPTWGLHWSWDGGSREFSGTDFDEGSQLGTMLWKENLASVHHRYPQTVDNPATVPGPVGEDFSEFIYSPVRDACRLDPVQVIKAARCLEYQSCEHPGWRHSEARAFLDALKDEAVCKLPGYEEAAWEIVARQVANG